MEGNVVAVVDSKVVDRKDNTADLPGNLKEAEEDSRNSKVDVVDVELDSFA